MTKSSKAGIDRQKLRDTCIVVSPALAKEVATHRDFDAKLEEAIGLAAAIDLDVLHAETVNIKTPRPATLLGRGAVERIAETLGPKDHGGDKPRPIVIVDAQLSPVQQRNLERDWSAKVLDRTGLILEIFGARARTREGRLQVDLAQLSYQMGRLVRSWTHLERQRGGAGFMGGPGETQIETDRRLIRQRIDRLKRDLADVARTRELHRSARRRVPHPVIALVGYTNAGKSTLFNRLTEADVMAKDQLFATLDPTMRAIDLPSGRTAILSDTVGFVSNLPHELVNAFHATLEEVIEADVIIHVRDIAHVDSDAQKDDVLRVLQDISSTYRKSGKTGDTPIIEALNKTDLLSPEDAIFIENRANIANDLTVPISAQTGQGCEELLVGIDQFLTRFHRNLAVQIPFANGAALAWLHQHADVVSQDESEEGIRLSVRIDPAEAARFEDTFGLRLTDVDTNQEMA